jgi:hypothetical protein
LLHPPHKTEPPGSLTEGLGSSSPALRAMGEGGGVGGGVERRGAAQTRCVGEAHQGGGGDEVGTGGYFQKEL